ncbi:MAG: FliH/SctL family protein [Negativicutes bacterium]|nr:FliH/SctL family protein [Negativicutes bacterium]
MFKVIRGVGPDRGPAVEIGLGRQAGDIADVATGEAALAAQRAELEKERQRVKLELDRLRLNAERELAEKRRQLAEERQRELEAARAEGLAAGRASGEQQVRQEMQAELDRAAAQAGALLETAHRQALAIMQANERSMLEIAVSVAEKLFLAKLEEDDEQLVLNSVRQAVAQVAEQPQLVVRVNPRQYEPVLAVRNQLQKLVGADRTLIINSDPAVTAGGCMIDTSQGSVDATVETRLQELRKTVGRLLQAVPGD